MPTDNKNDVAIEESDDGIGCFLLVTPFHKEHKAKFIDFDVDPAYRDRLQKYFKDQLMPPVLALRVCVNCWKKA